MTLDWRALEAAAAFAPGDRTMRRACRCWKRAIERATHRRRKDASRRAFEAVLRSAAVLQVAFDGDVDYLERRASQDPTWATARYHGITAAHMAALGGELGTLRCLVGSLGAKRVFEGADEYGRTLMHFAALGANPELIQYCITEGRCSADATTWGYRRAPLPLPDPSGEGGFSNGSRFTVGDATYGRLRIVVWLGRSGEMSTVHRLRTIDAPARDGYALFAPHRLAEEDDLFEWFRPHRELGEIAVQATPLELNLRDRVTVKDCAAFAGDVRSLRLVMSSPGEVVVSATVQRRLLGYARLSRSADVVELCSRLNTAVELEDWKVTARGAAAVGDSDTLRLCLGYIEALQYRALLRKSEPVLNDGFASRLCYPGGNGRSSHPAVIGMCQRFLERYNLLHQRRTSSLLVQRVEADAHAARPPKYVLQQQQRQLAVNGNRSRRR